MTHEVPQFAMNHKYKLANILEDSEDPQWTDRVEDVPPYRANLISSEAGTWGGPGVDDYHRPLIDLDYDAALVPSSTPGHHHLYIDKKMRWSDYEKLLGTLFEVGLIQRGVYENAVKRKFTSLRLPGISKYDHKANNPFPDESDQTEEDLISKQILDLQMKLDAIRFKKNQKPLDNEPPF